MVYFLTSLPILWSPWRSIRHRVDFPDPLGPTTTTPVLLLSCSYNSKAFFTCNVKVYNSTITNFSVCKSKSDSVNIVAEFREMHVSPAKHSYAWLLRKCDYRTERQTDSWTNRCWAKWSLCATMLCRRHKKGALVGKLFPYLVHIELSSIKCILMSYHICMIGSNARRNKPNN